MKNKFTTVEEIMEKPFAFKVENIEGDEVAITPSLEQAIAAAKNDLKYGYSPSYMTVTAYYENGHSSDVDLSPYIAEPPTEEEAREFIRKKRKEIEEAKEKAQQLGNSKIIAAAKLHGIGLVDVTSNVPEEELIKQYIRNKPRTWKN